MSYYYVYVKGFCNDRTDFEYDFTSKNVRQITDSVIDGWKDYVEEIINKENISGVKALFIVNAIELSN